MQVNLKLYHRHTLIKQTTIKVADKSTRTSLVILAKKWAHLSGVPSTTKSTDINTHIIHVPTALHYIEIEVDRLDTTYADQLIMKENSKYVWYVSEHSYGMKVQDNVLKGVWK